MWASTLYSETDHALGIYLADIRQEQREERETDRAARRNAPVWKRGYWWVFGRDEQATLTSEE